MKKTITSIAIILQSTFTAWTAVPETITQWTFEGDVTTPSTGSGTATNIGGTSSAFATGNGGGRGWNTSAYPAKQANSGTAGIQFSINTTGYEAITLDFDHRASGTASRWAQVDYSLNGGATWVTGFWNNGGGLSPHDDFYSFSVDFSSINGANNNAQFVVRIVSIFSPVAFSENTTNTFAANSAYMRANAQAVYSPEVGSGTGQYGSAGTWRFDNVTFSGIAVAPPPVVASVVWNQAGGGVWDSSAANWSGGEPVGNQFKDGDNVAFTNAAGGVITVGAGGVLVNTLTVDAEAGTYTFTGGSIGGGNLVKSGDGVLILEAANTYAGGTSINGGEVRTSADNQLGLAGTGLSINGGQLTLLDAIVSGRSISVGAQGATLDLGNFDSSFSAITGTGALTKLGDGDLTVSGWNMIGATNILGGNLILQLPTNTYSFGAGGTMDGNLVLDGEFRVNFGSGTIGGNGAIQVLQSGASLANTGSGLDSVLNVNIELNPDALPAPFQTNIGTTNGNTMTINGVISGESDVRFSAGANGGAGILTLNQQNTYTGQTEINNAQSGVIRLGVENALPTSTGVTWGITQASGSIDLNGFNQTLAYIATDSFSTGGIANTGGAAILTLEQDVDTVFAARIGLVSSLTNLPDANNSIQVIKDGFGTLTLSGASTYEDGTILRNGGIVAANNSALGTGNVIVESGTLTVANGVLLALEPGSEVRLTSETAVFRKEYLFDGFDSESFSNFGTVTGDFGNGSPRTSVSILGGQDEFGGLWAELSFTDMNPALGGASPQSLIANLTGLDNQLFVLQLTLEVPVSGGWYLGWFDPIAGTWANAVDGNYVDPDTVYQYAGYAGDIAFTDFLVDRGGTLTMDFLGAWGFDSASSSVWAVLNHNSSFAAIPEPSSLMLFGLGLGLWALRRRQDKN